MSYSTKANSIVFSNSWETYPYSSGIGGAGDLHFFKQFRLFNDEIPKNYVKLNIRNKLSELYPNNYPNMDTIGDAVSDIFRNLGINELISAEDRGWETSDFWATLEAVFIPKEEYEQKILPKINRVAMTSIHSAYPKFILHFDVNKTLINSDSVTGKTGDEILINQLAEDTVYCWQENQPEMSYAHFVKTVLVPGANSDAQIKKKRREIISQFLETVKQFPQISSHAIAQYELMKSKAVDSVFPSFVRLIEKLREKQASFVIILRTFGHDLKEVESEISNKTGIFFSREGEFKRGVLHLTGNENQTIEKVSDLFKLFFESREHLALQDNFEEWNREGESAKHGKKFVFDRHNATHLSLFFDDNLTGDKDHDIVAPFNAEGELVSTTELMGKILFTVHTGQAILNENYYIELVNRGLQEAGFQVKL